MSNKNEIGDRIKQLVDYYADGKNTSFAQKIGTSEANVRNYIKGILPKADILQRIVKSFDISAVWLLTGEGDMERKSTMDKNNQIVEDQRHIPLIPIDAVAGFGRGDHAGVRYEDCEHYSVPEFMERGVEFLIRVSGSSMYPKYANGDILACKKIKEILFIQWGKVHIIESISQGPLVKRIFEHDADTICCVSDNKENYPPFLMPKSDIRSLSIVLGVIRLE